MTALKNPPNVTIIFSTFNGGQKLEKTLQTFTELLHPPGGLNIIAVNNNSSDNSSEILTNYKHKLPITIINEPQQGKNFALNAALKEAHGELIVFTDDDVLADKHWILQLTESARTHPEFDIFGGTICPSWPSTPPKWIAHTTNLGMLYAITPDIDDGEIPAWSVWGPNMAIRRSALKKGGFFSTQVGPDGSNDYIMGSETEFLNRLEKAGHRARFVKSAVIYHQIRSEQMSRKWALQRYFRFGRSSYKLGNDRQDTKHRISGVERWLWVAFIKNALARTVMKPINGYPDQIKLEEKGMILKGQIHQSKLQSQK